MGYVQKNEEKGKNDSDAFICGPLYLCGSELFSAVLLNKYIRVEISLN